MPAHAGFVDVTGDLIWGLGGDRGCTCGGCRWKRLLKISQRRATRAKFDELVTRLKLLTNTVWNLQSEQTAPR